MKWLSVLKNKAARFLRIDLRNFPMNSIKKDNASLSFFYFKFSGVHWG